MLSILRAKGRNAAISHPTNKASAGEEPSTDHVRRHSPKVTTTTRTPAINAELSCLWFKWFISCLPASWDETVTVTCATFSCTAQQHLKSRGTTGIALLCVQLSDIFTRSLLKVISSKKDHVHYQRIGEKRFLAPLSATQ